MAGVVSAVLIIVLLMMMLGGRARRNGMEKEKKQTVQHGGGGGAQSGAASATGAQGGVQEMQWSDTRDIVFNELHRNGRHRAGSNGGAVSSSSSSDDEANAMSDDSSSRGSDDNRYGDEMQRGGGGSASSSNGATPAPTSTSTSPTQGNTRNDPLVRMLDESYGYMRPRPHDAKVHNMCLLKTHKTASTTMGSILFRFAAVYNGRVYNREGHELKRWKSWRVNTADGDEEEKVRATGVKDIEYSMVITHFGKSTGTGNTVWLREIKKEKENVKDKDKVKTMNEDDAAIAGNDPVAFGLVPSPEPAEDRAGPSPAPELDSSSAKDEPEWLSHGIRLRNFTDWCRAVVTPGSSAYEQHALPASAVDEVLVLTTIREPIGRFLSWYFFYIEPEQNYNYGANNFGGGEKDGSATASDEEKGGMYASQAVVADHLFVWMKNHGTLPEDLLVAERQSNATIKLDTTFNHQAREFLLWTGEEVEDFVRDTSTTHTRQIDFVAIADRFDESLIVLRHLANWDLRDLSYLRMLNSGADAASSSPLLRWDGLPIKSSLRARQLNSTMLEFIDANTKYDKMLYQYFNAVLDSRLDALRTLGVNVDDELEALRMMESDLAQMCHSRGNLAAGGDSIGRARTPEEDRVCAFYAMDDLTYEASVDTKGIPRNVPTAMQLSSL